MKHRIFLALLALTLAPAAAGAVGVGLGAYGGLSVPILQENAGNGSQFGLRVPVNVIPLLTVEPFYASSALGHVEEVLGGLTYTRSGPDLTTYGANLLFHLGGPVRFYPFGGIGSSTIKQSGTPDVTETSYNLGVGFGFSPMPKFAIDVRGDLNSVMTGSTSRKFANLTVGVSYPLFSIP